MIEAADSTQFHGIPSSFLQQKNKGVLPYLNGSYRWPDRIINDCPRHIHGIDVNGAIPDRADMIDLERFDATPALWPDWRAERRAAIARGDTSGAPKPYTSIAPGGGFGVASIVDATRAAGQGPVRHWAIAWYTRGGYAPTVLEVVKEILSLTGVALDPSDIWGCQYAADLPGPSGNYDRWVIYQKPEWTADA